jgi:hypothetical protein
MTVFSIMGDFSLRSQWEEGVKGIDQISHPIYHVGLKYRRILDKSTMNVYVSSFIQRNDIISLSETDEKKTGALYVTLKPVTDNKASITFDYYIKKNLFAQITFSLLMKKKVEKSLRKSLYNLELLSKKRTE